MQEVAYQQLSQEGFQLVSASSPQQFAEDTPTATLVRQILGAMAAFDRSQTVARLRAGRAKKQATTNRRSLKGKKKVVGRRSTLETGVKQRPN